MLVLFFLLWLWQRKCVKNIYPYEEYSLNFVQEELIQVKVNKEVKSYSSKAIVE